MHLKSTMTVAALAAAAAFSPALAQDYPSRPITNVVVWSAGGGTDTVNRLIMAEMEKTLPGGPTINVTNRTGGVGGSAGMSYVADQPADGHTLAGISESVVTAGVQGGWDQRMDVWYPFIVGGSPDLVSVTADSEYQTLEDLISAAEAEPGCHVFDVWTDEGAAERGFPLRDLRRGKPRSRLTCAPTTSVPSSATSQAGWRRSACSPGLGGSRSRSSHGSPTSLTIARATPRPKRGARGRAHAGLLVELHALVTLVPSPDSCEASVGAGESNVLCRPRRQVPMEAAMAEALRVPLSQLKVNPGRLPRERALTPRAAHPARPGRGRARARRGAGGRAVEAAPGLRTRPREARPGARSDRAPRGGMGGAVLARSPRVASQPRPTGASGHLRHPVARGRPGAQGGACWKRSRPRGPRARCSCRRSRPGRSP